MHLSMAWPIGKNNNKNNNNKQEDEVKSVLTFNLFRRSSLPRKIEESAIQQVKKS
jgi:hypothetical protein